MSTIFYGVQILNISLIRTPLAPNVFAPNVFGQVISLPYSDFFTV